MIQTIALILLSVLVAHLTRMLFIVRMHSFWSTLATDYLMKLIQDGYAVSDWRIDKIYGAIGTPRRNYWKLRNWSLARFAVNSDAEKVLKHWEERNHGDHANEHAQGQSAQGPSSAQNAKDLGRRNEACAAAAQAYGKSAEVLSTPMIGVDSLPTPTVPTAGKVISLSHAPYHRPFRRT